MAVRKLQDIKARKRPSIAAKKSARKAKAIITSYHPERVAQFVSGTITLGELEGISKPDQYKIAEKGYQILKSGKLEAAHKVFLGLHALDPYDAYFLTALGVIALQKKNVTVALQHFNRALEVNASFIPALVNRAEVLLGEQKLPEAAADLSRAISQDPGGKDPMTRRARAIAVNTKKLIEAATTKKSPASPAKK